MFLATLAGSASGAERSSVLRADGRRLRAVDERLDGSANGRGRSTGLDDAGLFDGGLREFPERPDRVGAGLRVVVSAVRNRLRVDGNDVERRLSGFKRFDFGSRGLRNERRLRRRLFDRRDLFGRLRSLRSAVDDLRRNGV
jgi:hypothetical protein